MTLHSLPAPSASPSVDDRLENIEARLGRVLAAVESILDDIQSLKARFGIDQ